jgi:dTDP-glucose 4,6-dehydratase
LQREPDITLAKELLGWEPKMSREQGMKITFEYFKGLTKQELFKSEYKDFSKHIRS